jgi:hypothetical protein
MVPGHVLDLADKSSGMQDEGRRLPAPREQTTRLALPSGLSRWEAHRASAPHAAWSAAWYGGRRRGHVPADGAEGQPGEEAQ